MKMNKSQHSILKHFLVHKQGLCIEDLASLLHISRTAVQQHFNVLENRG
jgi:predicted ArsR family transcriptional regulator